MKVLPPDEFEDALFLALLNLDTADAGPEFDLVEVCRSQGIRANAPDITRFAMDNNGIRGRHDVTNTSASFALNAEGRRHALQLEKSRKPKTVRERIADVPMGKGLWDIVKIGLGFALGLVTHKITGS